MNGLSFGYPEILVLAGIIVSLAGWALARERYRHRKALAAFGEEPLFAASSALPSPRRRLAGQALQAGAIALGLVALARPQLGHQASLPRSRGSGCDVLVLLDLALDERGG